MRSVMQSDVRAAVRAVLAVPAGARTTFCARLVQEAEWADRFVKRLGKLHPFWGNGTLLGAAQGHPLAPDRTFDDAEFCTVYELVLVQLCRRRVK